MTTFAGKRALITGASQGIGLALATAFNIGGAALVLTGRSQQKLENAAANLEGTDAPTPDLLTADMGSASDVDALAKTVRERYKSLDVLVHNAALYRRATWRDTTPEDLSEIFATNLFGPVRLTRHLLPLLERTAGSIVLLNSSVVQSSGANVGAYATSKQALRAFADSLRAEVSPAGIRVLSVYPGRTATPLQAGVFRVEGRPYQPERLLQPADVAAAITACLTLAASAEVTDLHLRPQQPA